MEKKRINWLDISRGVAFLMVIYSHLEYCNSAVMRYFSPMYLTTFFFVSGYLFKEKQSFCKVLEQRTRTLFLPFLSFGVVMIAMSNLLTFNKEIPLLEAVKGLLFQNGENQLLWFIAALYLYSLVFYWIERCCKNTKALLLVTFLLFWMNVAYSYWLEGPCIPWHLNTVGFGCFYMGLGKVYKEYESRIDRMIGNKSLIILVCIYIATVALSERGYSFSGSSLGLDALWINLIGVAVCVYISKLWIENSRLLLFVGANTLFYFAFHGKVYSLLQTITAKVFVMGGFYHSMWIDATLGFVITLLDVLILILPAMFVNRYTPWLLGKGFKLWECKK
jgi:fucose 4-O-acetylase-like acetyltransferase